jgi:hypothetical protein
MKQHHETTSACKRNSGNTSLAHQIGREREARILDGNPDSDNIGLSHVFL